MRSVGFGQRSCCIKMQLWFLSFVYLLVPVCSEEFPSLITANASLGKFGLTLIKLDVKWI